MNSLVARNCVCTLQGRAGRSCSQQSLLCPALTGCTTPAHLHVTGVSRQCQPSLTVTSGIGLSLHRAPKHHSWLKRPPWSSGKGKHLLAFNRERGPTTWQKWDLHVPGFRLIHYSSTSVSKMMTLFNSLMLPKSFPHLRSYLSLEGT